MCKSYRVDSFLEPLLSKLILDDPNIDSTRYKRASMGLTRGDLVVPGLNGSFTILDAMSIDPCNSSNEHLINSDVNNPLLAGEKYKIAKYAKPISSVNENSHAQYNLCPFVFSLLGSLGKAAMAFLEDFVVVVKERTGRIFNRVYWQNRIVFSIFKGMVKLISDSLSSFGKFSESLAINCFDAGEADKASTFLNPHQFGIKTIDGASVAAIASDTFFNAEENNFIFNLDFKNAFNSVKREAIFEVIKSDFPELSSFFYHFYGKESDLIFNSFALKSSSGVKQGDPLGPLLFCLAIHKTLNIIKQKYPSIKIVAYMDDLSLIGSFDLLELVAQEIADSYENIGLHLNASKCLLIGFSAQDLVINDSIVPFTNYSSDAFKFLGCWLGNVPQIQNELQVILEKMKIELDSISSLDIEKHIKFFMLKICYTGRITHILRSSAPSIALDFCRSFNSLRTEFFC
ncbi:hypothetical protein P9112_001131 [Eukaryota sp. TZLM1-RC]